MTSGANVVYAEAGSNPRDVEKDTTISRGKNISDCKKMLYEAGFEYILTAMNEPKTITECYKDHNI